MTELLHGFLSFSLFTCVRSLWIRIFVIFSHLDSSIFHSLLPQIWFLHEFSSSLYFPFYYQMGLSSFNSYCLWEQNTLLYALLFWSLNWLGETWIRGFFDFSPFLNVALSHNSISDDNSSVQTRTVDQLLIVLLLLLCSFFCVFFRSNRAWARSRAFF